MDQELNDRLEALLEVLGFAGRDFLEALDMLRRSDQKTAQEWEGRLRDTPIVAAVLPVPPYP